LNTIHQLKHKLRKEVLDARIALPPHVVAEKSARIIQTLLKLDEYRYASTIMTYLDFRNEVQTGELVKRAMADGKRVAVPLTDPASGMLTPSSLSFYPDELEPGAWGILEPKPRCVRPLDPSELDLIVVPGVAFDRRGNRLGYGGGFYDRFLLRTGPEAFYVAPAYEMQLCDSVPRSSQDVRMHCLITEERIIRIS
jgi:5-formyltetrahydrofolate cyclo-ligase